MISGIKTEGLRLEAVQLLVRTLAVAMMVLGPKLIAGEPPVLVPAPREVKWSVPTGSGVILAPDTVAIVLGNQASEPEQEAARLLRDFVAKRFGRQWPVLREGEEQATHKTLIILGQRTTCRRLDEACRNHSVELSKTTPGPDSYILEMVQDGGQLLVLVGGCNARAVEYGQDTLSQMLRMQGDDLTLLRASIRDVPAIPWGGRPQTAVGHYLRPGELDLYVLSRVNFIDLRGGIYAFEPGAKLDHSEIAQAVNEAHRRGLVVYATVNCGVPAKDRNKVLGTFRELLDLGADGLWLSFDDKGPGEDPVTLVKQTLKLGRQRRITGHLLAITPPKGSYPKITTDFNRKIMAVPGMEKALWFWTAVPSQEALVEARSIGLKTKPAWWHNWPRLFTTHDYVGVPPLSLGWSAPDYEDLVAGGECLHAVMPWGGNAFGQHYVAPVINWWGWNPEGHDWLALRRRIHGIVFGEEQAADATKFDERLQDLFALFRYSYKNNEDVPYCPPRVRDPAQKPAATALLGELAALLDRLSNNAPAQTLLPKAELQASYLDPMRKEVETHRLAAALSYPEDWWPAEQRKILAALYSGNRIEVGRLTAVASNRVWQELDQIHNRLGSYPNANAYVRWWQKRASLDADGWQALVDARHKSLEERVTEYSRLSVRAATMMEALRSPPLEWGIGRWQVNNRLLATVPPSPDEQFWGNWMAGIHEEGSLRAAVFAASRKTPGDLGEYAELPAIVPISGRRDRLGLLLFASSTNKDLFSNTMIKYRWAGYRFIELLWQDKVLWEADLDQLPEHGDWFMVRLPPLPESVRELPLRLRVEDRMLSLNNYTICYVGPIRLLELPQ